MSPNIPLATFVRRWGAEERVTTISGDTGAGIAFVPSTFPASSASWPSAGGRGSRFSMLVRAGDGWPVEEFPNISASQVARALEVFGERRWPLVGTRRGMVVSTDGLAVEIGVDDLGVPRIVYDVGPTQATRVAAWTTEVAADGGRCCTGRIRNDVHGAWLSAHGFLEKIEMNVVNDHDQGCCGGASGTESTAAVETCCGGASGTVETEIDSTDTAGEAVRHVLV